jgi:hypothetical protein
MKRAVVAGAISFVWIACPACAEPLPSDTNAFLNLNAKGGVARDDAEILIFGEQDGLTWSNAFLMSNKLSPFFCQPGHLSLTAPQLVDMIKRGVQDNPGFGKLPVGFTLLAVMRKAFPCPQNAN